MVENTTTYYYSHLSMVQKVLGEVATCDQAFKLVQVCHSYQVQDGEVSSVLGTIRKGDVMFLIDLKDAYFQSPIHPDSQPFLRVAIARMVSQVKTLCLGLSLAPQGVTSRFTGKGYNSFGILTDWSSWSRFLYCFIIVSSFFSFGGTCM